MIFDDEKALLLVERLLSFGVSRGLLLPIDVFAARNSICRLLKLTPQESLFEGNYESTVDISETAWAYMQELLDYCRDKGLLVSNSDAGRDLMDAEIMGLITPRESEVASAFYKDYEKSPETASDNFHNLSRVCNYIQVERIKKDKRWLYSSEYGDLEISINISKPEKDPIDIAAAKSLPQTAYPKCLLCVENVGFAGNLNYPARQNLRVIPMHINREQWYFQYSPYQYYNEHCIVLSHEHRPMKIDSNTFRALLDFLDILPHYFIGSNADLPIVGGSILSHDHFQGGRHVFPMEKALAYQEYRHDDYAAISVSLVKWPLSVIRISGSDRETLVGLAMHILNIWKGYSDLEADILAQTLDENGSIVPHNTITPIARRNKVGSYEFDLVLRNNRTTTEYPMGIFHPHEELHHIKKENIGLIEVMGLAILPGRLASELEAVVDYLTCSDTEPDPVHLPWADGLLGKYGQLNSKVEAEEVVRKEVGEVFKMVLSDAGVFKDTAPGRERFMRFMEMAGFVELLRPFNTPP